MKRYLMKVSLTFLGSIVIFLLLCRTNLSSELFVEQIKHIVSKPINSFVLQEKASQSACFVEHNESSSSNPLKLNKEPSKSNHIDDYQFLELTNDYNADEGPSDDEKLPDPLSSEANANKIVIQEEYLIYSAECVSD